MTTNTLPKIYLAGPDVFRRNARQHFASLAQACERHGLQALAPSDGLVPVDTPETEIAQRIFEINMGLLEQADGVIANLTPFRGLEPDSGTVFEVGVAVARSIPVVAYGVPQGSYADRVKASQQTSREDLGPLRDANDLIVEDLGLPLNLMLACSVKFAPSAEEALQVIASAIASKR